MRCYECKFWFEDNTFQFEPYEKRIRQLHGVCSLTNELHWSMGTCDKWQEKEEKRYSNDLSDYC